MKQIYVSSLDDESKQIFVLAEKYNLGIEILGFLYPYGIQNYSEKIEATKQKLTNISHRSLHGPFLDLYPASIDTAIVDIVNKRFRKAYDTAKCIGAKHIVFHAGYISKAFFPDQWLNSSISFWKSFMAQLDDDIEIHIENVCEDDYYLLNDLVEAVYNPMFSVCLDIGHVNVNSQKQAGEWIKGLNNKIKYVHLHNNDGIHDQHFGICNGTMNIASILEQLELYAPNARWSLETKLNETEKSVLWLEKNGFISE